MDSSGYVYVSGFTQSGDYPAVNGYHDSLTGSDDVFVTKLNPNSTDLVYSTYLGGSASQQADVRFAFFFIMYLAALFIDN